MDAISFVLGIKSSQLRSTHLSELIYRGRKLAGGTGAATDDADPTSAWVMAVYTDDDGKEHKWKRVITPQGASEYRINGRQVSAAQYNAALEDHNISIKARNFLVFQGDVEAIASQSPKDLTKLIEQISGSAEYKAEYESLKAEEEKAADTSAFNLNRRRGINAEIKQYQEQKKEAENYQAKTDKRDEAIVSHILWKLFHFQQNMDANKAEIERQNEELMEFERVHEEANNQLEEARTEQARATRSVNRQERNIKKKEKELEAKESSLVPLDEKIRLSQAHLKKYTNRIKEIERDREHQDTTVTALKKELAVVQKAQARFEKERERVAEETGTALSEADLSEYTRLKEQVNQKIASEQSNIDNQVRQQKTDAELAESLKSKVDNAQWQLKKLEGEIEDLQERREQLKSTIEQITQETDEKKKEYNAVTSERLRTEQKHTELNERLSGVLKELLEADDNRRVSNREQGMRETIAALKRIFPGVKGRVSELCKAKLSKYKEAMSTVLGRNFDAVVVDNEATAKQCIDYLRDQRAGQVTFLPLETIVVKPLNSNLKGFHRAVRMAIDTIEFDSSVERAMLYSCGNAVVCDDLKVAKYVCYEKGIDVKAVTLDGTVIHKGGLMTGGRSTSGGRQWDDQEVEAKKRIRDNLMAQISALPKNRRSVQEETLQGELTGLSQRLADNREELKLLERNLTSKNKEAKHLNKELSTLSPQYTEAAEALETLKSEIAELQAVVSAVEDKTFASFCQRLGYENIRVYEARQGSIQQEAAQRHLEFTTQISKLQNQLTFETERLRKTSERIDSLVSLSSRDEANVTEYEDEKAAIQEELDTISAELEAMTEELDARKTEQESRSAVVNELKRTLSARAHSLEETQKTIGSLEAEIERAAAGRYTLLRRCKLEEIDLPLVDESEPLSALPIDDTLATQDPDAMDLDDPDATQPLASTLHDYGIAPDFAVLPRDLQSSADPEIEESLEQKIKLLTAELDRMAPNMKAISRLSGVEHRLQETEAEFEASKQAAKDAKDRFHAVKTKRTALFKRAFDHISAQIDNIYKELTMSSTHPKGGQAYLYMDDSSEPYNEGVRYSTMPPMKRFRDMEHLSGGEKTMAALALLFAVHSFQPSPFFVLDEVDASLDNANVTKISNYIRKHAAPGYQFIVISLKAGLFQKSEALVGIYRDQVECSSRCLTYVYPASFLRQLLMITVGWI